MKLVRVTAFLVIALLQVSVPGSVIWKREQTLRHGRVWKFRAAPVDPIDAIRGRYVALRFAAEEVPQNESISVPFVYAVLREDPDGFAQVDHLRYN